MRHGRGVICVAIIIYRKSARLALKTRPTPPARRSALGPGATAHRYSSKKMECRNPCQAIAGPDFLEIGPKFLRSAARRSGNEQFQRVFLGIIIPTCPKKSAPRAPADFLKAISKAISLTVLHRTQLCRIRVHSTPAQHSGTRPIHQCSTENKKSKRSVKFRLICEDPRYRASFISASI